MSLGPLDLLNPFYILSTSFRVYSLWFQWYDIYVWPPSLFPLENWDVEIHKPEHSVEETSSTKFKCQQMPIGWFWRMIFCIRCCLNFVDNVLKVSLSFLMKQQQPAEKTFCSGVIWNCRESVQICRLACCHVLQGFELCSNVILHTGLNFVALAMSCCTRFELCSGSDVMLYTCMDLRTLETTQKKSTFI